MKNKIRIVHTRDHNFKFEHLIHHLRLDHVELYTGKGEWLGCERYTIQVYRGWRKGWVNAGDDHWYKQDTFGTFEEAKEALKYYDGTIQKDTVVWESE